VVQDIPGDEGSETGIKTFSKEFAFMAYSMKISAKKSGDGAIDGAIASIIAALVIGFMKQYITDMPAGTENAVSTVAGVLVSVVAVAAKRFTGNWIKHKEKKVKNLP